MAHERDIATTRIIHDPDIMVGKPVLKGTRIPMALVLGHLAQNPDLTELFAVNPHLTIEDVNACLAYAQASVERKRPLASDAA